MDSPDLEGLFQSFDSKISDVCGKLALLKHYQEESREECLELNNIIGNVQYMILNVTFMLEQQEEHLLSQIKRCEDIFTLVNAQSEYIEANLPAFQVCDKQKGNNIKENNYARNGSKTRDSNMLHKSASNIKSASSNTQSKTMKKTAKKEVSSVSGNLNKEASVKQKVNEEATPVIQTSFGNSVLPLSEEEFNSISSYMRGRLKLEELNDFVSAFNLTIQEKYKLISSYSLHSSNEEIYKRFQNYKSQENADTKGVYFCTANDIKELSSVKSETQIRKMIPCLVHCKRIKENRGNPVKMIRYCLINNN